MIDTSIRAVRARPRRLDVLMQVKLTITEGPHHGREFLFDGHETFLVGRSKDAHFRLPKDDPYFSRRHFLIEANPPRCRIMDLKSRNGTFVNDERVLDVELNDGDVIRGGTTTIRVSVIGPQDQDLVMTGSLPGEDEDEDQFVEAIPCPPPQGTEYQADLARPEPAANEKNPIPGYRIDGIVGKGGMGIVYRAMRLADRTQVAVKTIQPASGTNNSASERFFREASILSQLDHPHIVKHYESGKVGQFIYFIMELVEGTDADKILEQGALSVRMGTRLICQLLKALDYAHSRGFVHRDIKPSNILIQKLGDRRIVKLADFGLARAYQSAQMSGLTLQGEIRGTIPFMAPEQATHLRKVQPAADQYSAAATLYNLLTDDFPHDLPPSAAQQVVHIVTEAPIPIRRRRADIPDALAQIIHRALAREPEDRFADVGTFRRALKPFAE